MNKLGTLF